MLHFTLLPDACIYLQLNTSDDGVTCIAKPNRTALPALDPLMQAICLRYSFRVEGLVQTFST